MPEPLVRAEGISRTYGSRPPGVTALADASFEIAPGQTVSLMGPSGSGKSTLLHLIAGLDLPTGGAIEWPALGTRDELRPGPVAVAFQGPSLLPPLTVLENVALPMLLAGAQKAEAEDAAREMLARFEVDELEAKLPEEISGGQSQRAGLARALAGAPRLVLTDEPTGQQDRATGQRLMVSLMELIEASGAAVVIATHDRTVAAMAFSRWRLHDGQLLTEAAPSSP